jgi:uncharacterized protein (DUF1501 family)
VLQFESKNGVKTCDGLTRRDFLRAGALGAGAISLSLADLHANNSKKDINCIFLFLVGGPSQLDTWDLKPDAPEAIRGPFRPIATNVPGIQIGEHFPRMAKQAQRFALVRSLHHEEAPIHETGQQMMQTGHVFRGGQEYPHYGAVLSHRLGARVEGMPPFVVLPSALGSTGVSVSHGQGAGSLGSAHEPFVLQADPARWHGQGSIDAVDSAHRACDAGGRPHPAFDHLFNARAKKAFDLSAENDDLRARYGRNTFGQSCLLARRLIEGGVRLATVNMFDTVFNRITWDCHADGGALATTLDDYRDTLCPMFDAAYATLLDDLAERGLLDTTLVLALGEFGRTPLLNPRGGRDHWPGVWSILFAGGGVNGGQTIGSSDRIGSEPRDRPVTPAEVAATIYRLLGIRHEPLVAAEPIAELFSRS